MPPLALEPLKPAELGVCEVVTRWHSYPAWHWCHRSSLESRPCGHEGSSCVAGPEFLLCSLRLPQWGFADSVLSQRPGLRRDPLGDLISLSPST